MKNYKVVVLFLFTSLMMNAQVEKTSELYRTLKVRDSILFNASFNTCNLKQLDALINDDFEFYHDMGGFTEGKDTFIEATKNNLCKSKHKLRRELDETTLEVFALKDNSGKLYAAIQNGVHSFYRDDIKGSTAKFTHVWILKNKEWKLKRVLSYDHKEPKFLPQVCTIIS